jgi:peroxiredoxin
MQCRSHAAQLGRQYEQLKAANFEVLLILGGSVDKTRRYVESLHLPFLVLADPEREIYHRYGLEVKFFLQRTASVVIDCDGIIRYVRTTTSPMIWLQEANEVLGFVKSISAAC